MSYYERLCTQEQVDNFTFVRRLQQRAADVCREILAEMVEGEIRDPNGTGKQFLWTRRGLFRIATSRLADNSTEDAAHRRLGAETLNVDDDKALQAFFEEHRYPLPFLAVDIFHDKVERALLS